MLRLKIVHSVIGSENDLILYKKLYHFSLDMKYESMNVLLHLKNYLKMSLNYSVVSIKRTGSLNYFEVFAPP